MTVFGSPDGPVAGRADGFVFSDGASGFARAGIAGLLLTRGAFEGKIVFPYASVISAGDRRWRSQPWRVNGPAALVAPSLFLHES